MDTLTKLQKIRDFEKWAAAHQIDASPLALLEYLDREDLLKAPTHHWPKENPYIQHIFSCEKHSPHNQIKRATKDPHATTYTMPGAVGYTVFVIDGDEILKMEINHFSIYRYVTAARLIDSPFKTERTIDVNIEAFGKTVFFTKPEAERALAKRRAK